MPDAQKELRVQIAELLFNIGYGIDDKHPAESIVDGMHAGYSEYAASQIMRLIDAYAEQKMREATEIPNGLLRSMWQIAERNGIATNWETFRKQLKAELEREHKIMYPEAQLTRPAHQTQLKIRRKQHEY